MRRPISFAYGNLVFGRDMYDAWAVYRLEPRSYAGLTRAGKEDVLRLLAAFAYTVEADFTLLRVSRPWSLDRYEAGVRAVADARHAPQGLLDAHLERHRVTLAGREVHRPEIFVSVRLDCGVGSGPGRQLLQAGRRLLGLGDPASISQRQLDDLLGQEVKVRERIADFVDCERATSRDLHWLIRRAFSRGVGDPVMEDAFQPQALVVDAPEGAGGLRYKPLEVDVLRLFDAPINVAPRSLRIESEAGDSHQALLCLGALPEAVPFPSSRAELLFAPLEAVDFPVDAAFTARYVPNEHAVRLTRRRIVDADNIYKEESSGEHGPTSASAVRPQEARELEQYLTAGDRPPLLRGTVSLCVSAGSREELERRVDELRREYGTVQLHRPLGDQLSLFTGHLPGQGPTIRSYEDLFTVEQFGAMVPIATHAVGSESGPYVGYTLSGSQSPVLFDPTEASRSARAPAALLTGTPGSGKTLFMELVMYQAFLAGSTICDIDPKGDHALERLPGMAEQMEIVEMSTDDRFRGMLDPLRVAPEDTREDLAVNFLTAILPEPVPAEWQTEIRHAVSAVVAKGGRSCTGVIDELEGGERAAREAGRALRVHAESGLARLGFGARGTAPPVAGSKPVTSLRIRNLTLPLPGTARRDMAEEERIGQAVLRLLAVYALALTSQDARRHSVLGFDEAWVLLSDSSGRALMDRISRLGRSQNVTPLLATQVLADAQELEGLVGAVACFGVETEAEAEKALRLLRLDADDEDLRLRLMTFRRGRCLLRDYAGRVGPVQVDLVSRELLVALDTTPRPLEAGAA